MAKEKGLTEEEFERLKGLNEAYLNAKGRVADTSLFQKRSLDILDATENSLHQLQEELVAKYGEVTIDSQSGLFK
jgi:hypothetical protein